jgi:hypothetical protein
MADIWDVKLDDVDETAGDYPVLPAGTYEFQVESVKGSEFLPKPGGKIGHCAQIALVLRVDQPDREYKVFENLYTDPTTIWKITTFAKSIGLWHEGMTLPELMRNATGEIGNAELYVHEYNGKKSNRVKKFIFKKGTVPAAPAPSVEIDSDDLPF